MLQKIIERLKIWGYEVETAEDPEELSADELAIQFCIEETEAYIKNYCNISEIPEELEKSEINMVAIEFLKEKAMAGSLDATSLRLDAISSITEGDVSVSYASGSTVSLASLYSDINSRFEADLLPFRRLRW